MNRLSTRGIIPKQWARAYPEKAAIVKAELKVVNRMRNEPDFDVRVKLVEEFVAKLVERRKTANG